MLSIPKPSRLAAFETMVQSNLKTKILGYMGFVAQRFEMQSAPN